MCAGSNGDGYHKFTSTNKEHNKNKKKFKEFEGLK
jgi:cell division protein YceG involved in septum cleavage